MNSLQKLYYIATTLATTLVLYGEAAFAQNLHAGTWETKEISIKDAEGGCRYLEAVTATFHLSASVNGSVTGFLNRRFERLWWTLIDGCVMPGNNSNVDFTLRQDNWTVTGDPHAPNVQSLKGIYAGCTTDCKDPWTPPQFFSTQLVRAPNGMFSGKLTGIAQTTIFRDSIQSQIDSSNASAAFMKLLQPLLEGRCDEFLSNSVDADSKLRFERDLTCSYSRQLVLLLPPVIQHRSTQAHSVALASVLGMSGPLLMSDGDVLVQIFLVVNATGGGLPMSAALRKQTNGTWRVRDLVQ